MNLSSNHSAYVNHRRLFVGMCLAIIPTGASFVFVSNIFQQLKTEFILTNAQVGYIGGAVLWGMALSLLLVGPFLEKIGLKKATVGAFFGHLIGTTLFLAAAPDRKSTRLNSSHVAISYAVFRSQKKLNTT